MKKTEKDFKEPSPGQLDQLLSWVSDHPLVGKIIQQKREEIRRKRRTVIDEIQKLEKDHEPKMRDLVTEVDRAEALWKEARGALSKAESEYVQAKQKLYEETFNHQSKVASLKKVLRDTSSPLIDDFIAEMLTLYDKVRHDIRESTYDGVKRNIVSGEKVYIVHTNIRTVQRAMSYILGVIQRAEAL